MPPIIVAKGCFFCQSVTAIRHALWEFLNFFSSGTSVKFESKINLWPVWSIVYCLLYSLKNSCIGQACQNTNGIWICYKEEGQTYWNSEQKQHPNLNNIQLSLSMTMFNIIVAVVKGIVSMALVSLVYHKLTIIVFMNTMILSIDRVQHFPLVCLGDIHYITSLSFHYMIIITARL